MRAFLAIAALVAANAFAQIGGPVIGQASTITPPSVTSPIITATTKFLAADGLTGTPSYTFTNFPTSGIYTSSGNLRFTVAGTTVGGTLGSGLYGTVIDIGGNGDAILARPASNSIRFGLSGTVNTTSRTEMNKAVASIADAVATSVMTITIPNAAHSASLLVRLTCSLGAGGTIGANEATATNTYVVAITRTAGVNATAAISVASGGAATAVAGAATVTATATLAAVVGAVGAPNTIDVQATVTRSAGSSTNHTCLVYGQLMNANVTGVTIS